MNEIFENLYDMTAFSNIIAEPQFLIMYAIAFVVLKIKKIALILYSVKRQRLAYVKK